MSDSEPIAQKAPPSDSEASESATTAPRSRSQSRRARRRKQQSAKKASKQNMPAVKEEDQGDEEEEEEEEEDSKAMQPFNYIGPDETSMDGPVTYARAQRGEIPMRKGNPKQALATGKGDKGNSSKLMDQDGLKLKLELNLDVEIELKASIRGDLTLALLA